MNTITKILHRLIIAEPETMETGCWEWPGHRDGCHYGHVSFQGRRAQVHRLVFEHFVEKIPPGMELDHRCRNRICANFEHLELVTPAEHRRRGCQPYTPKGPRIFVNHLFCPHGSSRVKDCRECARERHRAWSRARAAEKTFHVCHLGHPLIEKGFRLDGRPKRYCPVCLAAAGRKGGWPSQSRNSQAKATLGDG